MRINQWDIDAIVHEVVERVRAGRGEGMNHAPVPVVASSEQNPGSLRLEQSLITLATIEGQIKGITKMIVSPSAVVTPAVYDELNQQGIELARASCGEKESTSRKIWIGIDPKAKGENQWKAILDKPHLTIHRGPLTSLIEKVAKTEGPAMIITCCAPWAACLANRHNHIRAAAVRDPVEAGEVLDAMSANLLVVHPDRTGPIQIQKIVDLLEKSA